MGWGEQRLPRPLKGSPWRYGKGALPHGQIYFALMPKPSVPGTEMSSQSALTGSSSPALPRPISPFWHLEDIELRSWSSGGSCSFGSNCCILVPSLHHSAWFGAYNFLLGHPLRLVGLSSPGDLQSLSSGLGPGQSLNPIPNPEAAWFFQPWLCVMGQPDLGPRHPYTQQAPVSAQCRFCSMSTSCSSHVTSVLLRGSCWWGRLAPLANGAPCQGRRGSGSQPPAPLSLLEMCLLQSARSGHICLTEWSASLCSTVSPASASQQRPGRAAPLGRGPHRPPLWSRLLAVWSFSALHRHCSCGIATSRRILPFLSKIYLELHLGRLNLVLRNSTISFLQEPLMCYSLMLK